jgi:phenylpropionate dioxygenase-like ring-hydroxylating dioxygenase large terminal subunit
MNYPRNAWYVASWSQDVEAGKLRAISILGEPIVLWRSGERLVALADRCVHRLAPLSMGRCEGMKLRCMYHGFLYDAEGRVVEIPGQAKIPAAAHVNRYPVVEKHSWIWVWMGDPDAADEALVPPAVGLEDPEWILGRGNLDYAASANLINDNLLDFSHLTFVHANSFGVGQSFSNDRPRVTALPRGVRFERWVVGEKGPGVLNGSDLVDGWSTYDFLVPGVLLMWSGNFAPGTAEACDFNKPDYSKAISGVTFTSQAVTPTSEKTARYFFSWGPHRDHGDAALRDRLMGVAAIAFNEDRVIIEAQQRVIDVTQDPKVLPSAHDRGVTMFNQLVARLVRQESSDARSGAGH